MDACQQAFGNGVAPLYLPIRDGAELSGLYGLLSQTPADPPEDAEEARGELIEGIIEQSEDETLMERYLGGEDIEVSTLIDDLETAVARGRFHPVIPICASSGIGLDALLEVLAAAFPRRWSTRCPRSAAWTAARPAADRRSGRSAGRRGRAHLRGRLRGAGSLVRVFSGTLRRSRRCTSAGTTRPSRRSVRPARTVPDDEGGHDATSGCAHLQSARLDPARGGGVRRGRHLRLTKLGTAETGDTVSASDHPLLLSCWSCRSRCFRSP